MLAKVFSAAVLGVDAYEVEVEIDISGGLPSMMIVGLPDTAVQESRERVRSAIRNAGLPFPTARIVVNLAPADIRKEGPTFDLPIALAVLAAQGVIPQHSLQDIIISGELALDGILRPVRGAINIALFAAEAKKKQVILPPANASEAAVLPDIEVIAPRTLLETVEILQGKRQAEVVQAKELESEESLLDFADVKGQAAAKRALEIAAAGRHNMLMTGPPGSGKTMLARRLPSIMPKLTRVEAIEVTRIHSTAGQLVQSGLITTTPYRSPHHTVSDAGLVGGGNVPKPGEISLAHRGVLFLDEFPEFSRRALEVLRQPLEDGVVTISRARASLTFPARFMLVAAQNPCPCGHYGDPEKPCSCSPSQRQRYRDRISGPLMDRLDLRLTVPRLSANELMSMPSQSETSHSIRQRVAHARDVALQRQGCPNAELMGQNLRKYTQLSATAETLTRSVVKQLALTGRGYDRLIRVARTIADIEQQHEVNDAHIAEAVSYRTIT